MFSSYKSVESHRRAESTFDNIYQTVQNLLGRSPDSNTDMDSQRESSSDLLNNYSKNISPTTDLMGLSPDHNAGDASERSYDVDDLLTASDFDNTCDITMQELAPVDYIDSNGLDYLMKCADSCNRNKMLDRGKESLFVKFDPLYAKRNCTPIDQLMDNTDCGYESASTASYNTDVNVMTPKRSVSAGAALMNYIKEKPTQVVPPAVNRDVPVSSCASTRNVPILVRSASAIISPTQVNIDSLLRITDNSPQISRKMYESYTVQHNDHFQSLKMLLQKREEEILQLRQENCDLKYSLQNAGKKLALLNEDMGGKINKLTQENTNILEKNQKLEKQIQEKTLNYKQISIVLEEYEKTITSLIGEQQRDKKHSHEEHEALIRERNQAMEHLASMESSFNDLLTKYEKCKTLIAANKDREDLLKQENEKYDLALKKHDSLYSTLKNASDQALQAANETLDNLKKSHAAEITKLNATIKKQELELSSLQETLARKIHDNKELSSICDDLISKVY